MNIRLLSAAAVVALACQAVFAEVRVPAVFGEHGVLQRGKKTAVWGWGKAGEAVAVEYGDAKGSTVAGADGKWRVNLDLSGAGKEPGELVIRGENVLTFKDVVVGEVWLCGGQSNMEFRLQGAKGAAEEIGKSADGMLRHFKVAKKISKTPVTELEGKWEVASPEVVGQWTAVGYYFGKEIRKTTGSAVGLINDNWGGTPAEAWTSEAGLRREATLKPFVEVMELNFSGAVEPARLKTNQRAIANWDRATEEATTRPERKPKTTRPAEAVALYHRSPAALYNGMIHPVMPYTLAGVIWYQGEGNTHGNRDLYRELMGELIEDWRTGFENDRLPFYQVQLANFMAVKQMPGDSAYAEIREAQKQAAEDVGNAGIAVAFDVGEANDIHPKDKATVGHRLALLARKNVYGERSLVASGPVYKSMEVDGNKVKLSFGSVGGGLTSKGGVVKGFQICGEDQKWNWAEAKIEDGQVVVWSDAVKMPVAVRYGWADNLPATLYNVEGLPASPFRTDTFPLGDGK